LAFLKETVDMLRFEALKTLSSAGEPLGAGSISEALRRAGFPISEAAAGRILRDMRNGGVLRKVGFRGHEITREGEELLRRTDAQLRVSETLRSCLEYAGERGKRHLCDALLALRSLVRETAFETIAHASDDDLSLIEATIEKYAPPEGEPLPEGLFREFYQTLLATSQIPMFEHFFDLLEVSVMNDTHLREVFQKAERSLGGTYETILSALKARQPEAAASMVSSQIDRVISQVMAEAEDAPNQA